MVVHRGREKYEITYYEGLVRKTASIYAARIQEDYEDICSILRIKVWRALETYDPARSSQPVERYVFGCVTNQIKDLLKRKRRTEVFWLDMPNAQVEDDYRARFPTETALLQVSDEEVYAEVERETPVIPSTLSRTEREVVLRLYVGLNQREVGSAVGLTRSEMERVVRSIRTKMADWRPTVAVEQPLAA